MPGANMQNYPIQRTIKKAERMFAHPARFTEPVTVNTGFTFHGQPIEPEIDAGSYFEVDIGWSEILLAATTFGRAPREIPWVVMSKAIHGWSWDFDQRIAQLFRDLDVEIMPEGVRRLCPSLWLKDYVERYSRTHGSYFTGMTFAQLMCRRLGVDATYDVDRSDRGKPLRGGGGKGSEADLYGSSPLTRPQEWLVEAKGSLVARPADMFGARKDGAGQLDAARTRDENPWCDDHFQILVATAGNPHVAVLVDIGSPHIVGVSHGSELKRLLQATPGIPSAWRLGSFTQRMFFGLALREAGATGFLHLRALDVWIGLADPIRQLTLNELEYADRLARANPDITVREVAAVSDDRLTEEVETDVQTLLALQLDGAFGPDGPTAELSIDSLGRIVALGGSWSGSAEQAAPARDR